MTPQPSPTNLSDELKGRLQTTIWMASRIGEDLMRNQNLMDEAVRQITAAYAKAIRECVPEKKDSVPAANDLYERSEQIGYADGFNAAINTLLKNLKERGLIQ